MLVQHSVTHISITINLAPLSSSRSIRHIVTLSFSSSIK